MTRLRQSDVEQPSVDQIIKHLYKLINVGEDQRARPSVPRSSASAWWVILRADITARSQSGIEQVNLFDTGWSTWASTT